MSASVRYTRSLNLDTIPVNDSSFFDTRSDSSIDSGNESAFIPDPDDLKSATILQHPPSRDASPTHLLRNFRGFMGDVEGIGGSGRSVAFSSNSTLPEPYRGLRESDTFS